MLHSPSQAQDNRVNQSSKSKGRGFFVGQFTIYCCAQVLH